MPQLVPFYWMNLLTTGIAAFTILIYISSTIILPNILRLLIARSIIVRV
uniref:ATP synthase protein 8 n=1 Tax=Candida buenavistaensis TaxID=434039 RepID=S5TDW3_9ASCO|nr:ATP synthase F0 subunit 8 [Candida buenavistaensis]AGS44074.1 ATP synthase F0 subunit 8 [Candida buenavistaensis]